VSNVERHAVNFRSASCNALKEHSFLTESVFEEVLQKIFPYDRTFVPVLTEFPEISEKDFNWRFCQQGEILAKDR
jgi:hypothetical protein